MNVGIVTTWFERGAAYVSKQFEDVLSIEHDVFVYARGGEKYAIGDPVWDKPNVTWGVKRKTPFSETIIHKDDFLKWIKNNKIDIVLFNEQRWWYPLIWCDELKIPTICYVDYYQKNTIPLFAAYSSLICNTKRHYSVFNWNSNAHYLPWGTNCNVFKPSNQNFSLVNDDFVTFFHSCGIDPYRKGTEILLLAAETIEEKFKLVIHTQLNLRSFFDANINIIIDKLESAGKLEIIERTVSAPGLFHLGDVYIYPSRLEGIGLTVAEAEACGLIPLVTNNAPMNEFVNKEIGYLIEVADFFSRQDGYYWPECTPSVDDLKKQMIYICNNKEKIVTLKEANYNYANMNLNWDINSKQLISIVEKTKYIPISDLVKQNITNYEEGDLRRVNKYILKYYWFFVLLTKLFQKINSK